MNLNSGIIVKTFISPRILVKTIVTLDGVAVLIAQKSGPSLCFASNYGLSIQRNRWNKAHVQFCAGKAKQSNEALHLGISVHWEFFCAHVCHHLAVVEEHFRHKVAEALNANTANRKSSVGVPRIGRDSPSVLITGSLQQFTLILRFAQKRLGRAGPIMGNDGAVQYRIRLFDFLKPAAGKQLPGRKMFCDTGIIQDGFHKASRAFPLVVCFFRNGSNNIFHRSLVGDFAVHDFGCIKNPIIFVYNFRCPFRRFITLCFYIAHGTGNVKPIIFDHTVYLGKALAIHFRIIKHGIINHVVQHLVHRAAFRADLAEIDIHRIFFIGNDTA